MRWVRRGRIALALAALAAIALWAVQRPGRDAVPPAPTPSQEARRPAAPPPQMAEAPRVFAEEALPVVQPYMWSAAIRNGEVTLTGHVPSPASLDEMRRMVRDMFPDRHVVEGLQPASGFPANIDFAAATNFAFKQLARLRAGRVDLVDATLSLQGEGTSKEVAAQIKAAMRKGLPPGVRAGSVAIVVASPSPYAFEVRREAGALTLTGYIPDEAARGAIRELVRERFLTEPVVDKLRLGDGAPRGYLAGVSFGLEQLSLLATGEVVVSDTTVQVNGESLYEQTAEAIMRTVSAVPLPGWTGKADVKVRPPVQASAGRSNLPRPSQ